MIPKFRAWNSETKEIEVFETYEEISELFLALSADDGFYSIMQSTGLHDKNGKEIFEGDILGTNDGLLNGVVEYRADLGMWTNSLLRYQNFERLCNRANSREIIGNIYKNPELLEVE